MSAPSQNDTPQGGDLASVATTTTATGMMSKDTFGEAAPRRSQQDQQRQQSEQDGQAGPMNERGVVDTTTGYERSSTTHSPDSDTIRDHSAMPKNTPTGNEGQEQQEEGGQTTKTSTTADSPMSSATAHSLHGDTSYSNSVVPTIVTTGSEGEEEDQEVQEAKRNEPHEQGEEQNPGTTTNSSPRGHPVPSSTGQYLHNHSAVPTNTPTGHGSQEEDDEDSRATTSGIEERRLPPLRLTFRVAARDQSAHSLDSSDSVVTPAISTAGATVGDSEDMDGRATPGDGLLPWSAGSLVSNEEEPDAISTGGATTGDGTEGVTAMTEVDRAADENEGGRRQDTVPASTEGGDDVHGWTSIVDDHDASPGGNGSGLDFELTLDPEARNGRHVVILDEARNGRRVVALDEDPRELDHFDIIQTVMWDIFRQSEEPEQHPQDAPDVPFTPQTPTHTPVVPAHLSRGALAADHLIPALDLAAVQGQQGRGENRRQARVVVENLQTNRRSETRSNELTLIHSDEEGEAHATYSMGPTTIRVATSPNVVPEPEDRVNLRLPNPYGGPTFQLLVTVPYRSSMIGPVRATFEIPQFFAHGVDPDQNALLDIEVDHADHWHDGSSPDAGIPIHDDLLRETSADDPTHEDLSRDTSATTRFVEQLPHVPLADINLEDQECPICREVFARDTGEVARGEQPPEDPARTPCGHIVGNQCLLRWLLGEPGFPPNNTCPSCRGHLGIPRRSGSWQPVYSRPQGSEHGPNVEQPQPPDQEPITDEDLERQLLAHLHHWTSAAEGDSLGRADQSSWDHMRHRNATAARDAALAQELIPPAIYAAIPTYEAEQHLLFEAVRLSGFLRYPYIPDNFGPRRVMTDEQLYEHLRGGQWQFIHSWNLGM